MTDSPTGDEQSKQDEKAGKPVPQIPKPRLDEAEGKRKAAEARSKDLEAKLTDALGSKEMLAETFEAALQDVIDKQIGPLQRKLEVAENAMKNGLNDTQARKVMEIQDQYQGMTFEDALALAKAKVPDQFPSRSSRSSNPPLGMLPPGSAGNRGGSDGWDLKDALASAKTPDAVQQVVLESIRRKCAIYHPNET